MLVDIIKSNNAIGARLAELSSSARAKPNTEKDDAYAKAILNIKTKTLAYCDNSKGKVTHNTNKPMTGIKERINKKTGIVRQNLMGKRCDKTARTVVGPDPTLRLDEVAIPESIASTLTTQEHVTPLTIRKLTELTNSGKVATIIKKNGVKINVQHATIKRGTQLFHGDVVLSTDGTRTTVTDCKMQLKETDRVQRYGTSQFVPATLPVKRHVDLEIGDIVERYLVNGDPVLLNRQPTLHRNSMQGMRVVVKPGKTFRVNLAIVSGFNMDFDGDESNTFSEETLESKAELLYISNAKRNILSAQTNKSEMVIVQDSLLGAYNMTKRVKYIDAATFMNCLYRTSAFERYPDYAARLSEIRTARNEQLPQLYSTHALFGFILPNDFHAAYNHLTIRNGVVVDGYFDKMTLKSSHDSIVRLLCLDYDNDTAAQFIDDVQFLTNAWLEIEPFSIGISDCLIGSHEKTEEIRNVVDKYFLEAEQMARTNDNRSIKETRINCSLNKAKDIGLKIAKDSLRPDNNFISTVLSGSKGDYFNIAQITGLLGQQNISGRRPYPELDNAKRTLIHYPHVITDAHRKYESRGFVAASFMSGMNPKEMFFHAMTGREGMISTAMGTATSGYRQRSCVKLNEDLKIAYDGTVRDANNNVYQFAYGNHGFDSATTTVAGNDVYPVDIARLADRLTRDGDTCRPLTVEQRDEMVAACKWNCQIPKNIFDAIWAKHERYLRDKLDVVSLPPHRYETFRDRVVGKYHTTRATPGDSVGIIGAQSIGEKQTQTNLNTFHTAGKLQNSSIGRFEELLNMTKSLKVKTSTIYLKHRYDTSEDVRAAIGCSLVGIRFSTVAYANPTRTVNGEYATLEYELNFKVMYGNRLNPKTIANALLSKLSNCVAVQYTSKTITIAFKLLSSTASLSASANDDASSFSGGIDNDTYNRIGVVDGVNGVAANGVRDAADVETYRQSLENTYVCGLTKITAMYLDHDGTEWYIVTEGSDFRALLAHELVDTKRLYCNDVWEIYECLGISAARRVLFDDIKKVVNGVNDLHIQLLVDKMTYKGKPTALTRYTMRVNDVGPLSKATYEESTDILINAAVRTEVDYNNGVSSAIISGNRTRIGTGMMGLKLDMSKFATTRCQPIDEVEDERSTTPPSYY